MMASSVYLHLSDRTVKVSFIFVEELMVLFIVSDAIVIGTKWEGIYFCDRRETMTVRVPMLYVRRLLFCACCGF
jgi:hypothetical protein